MRRMLGATIVAAVLTACGNEGTGPAKFDPASLVGVWEVVPDSTWSCWSGKPYLWFQVTQKEADGYASGALNVFSTWSRARESIATGNSITGHFDTDAKTATFRLWWRTGETFARLDGTLDGTTIRGRLTSPAGMAALSACASGATAKRL